MTDLFGNEPVKALTWKEPFATAMLFGKIETRSWRTGYFGLVLICAGKKVYTESDIMKISGPLQTQNLLVSLNASGFKENPGHAIAIGRLVKCRPMRIDDENKCFVKYDPDRCLYCHVYRDVRRIKPIPWTGSRRWKNVDKDFLNQIEFI